MGVKKVYSKPIIEIDRSVFESIELISDDEWIGWDDSDIDESSESGGYTDGGGAADVSSFDEEPPVTTDAGGDEGFEWNW